MIPYKKILYFLILLIITISCQTPYYPEDLDDNEKILVVEGFLTNKPGPYHVSLSWAAPFETGEISFVQNATVIISDDKGNREVLTESGYGDYLTKKDGIKGTIGNTYKLRIELADGSIYESIPSVMKTPPVFDTIYAERGILKKISKNTYGDIIIHEDDGLNVYIDMKTNDHEQGYFRYSSRYYAQHIHTIPGAEGPISVYCPSFGNLNDMPNVKAAIFNGTNYIVKKQNMGFLTYIVYKETDSTSARWPYGWVIANTLYTIDVHVFEYYQAIVDQLNASERIFDPVATQITGNIKCITDTTKLALGIMEVASTNTFYTAFYWYPGIRELLMKNLPGYIWPDVDTCSIGVIPDFWITINTFYE
ncbi:MAG: DUF4249 domain-containing protein [Bacteroidales bacterium]|nr:DUF4249 domain-containing protein [Bacteroidales bacterium]